MPFLTPLSVTSIRGTDNYRLNKPLRYRSDELHREFIVPSNVLTNFASIPKPIRFWMDNDGGYIRDAAVVHDYLYSKESEILYPDTSREIADGIIREGMKDLGASWVKRASVYWALRAAGWTAYKKGMPS